MSVDAGWRIYSSGPGIYVNLLLGHVLGQRRYFGERRAAPLLPTWLGAAVT
jgi:cellobiose phosphorylase